MGHKIQGFPDFGAIERRDGSIEIAQDYIYYSPIYHIKPSSRGLWMIQLQLPDPQNLGQNLPLGLVPGATLRIPVIGGGYSIRDVRKVVGSIVELVDPLNSDPIPGHQVRRIQAYSQAYIDMRLRDLIEKGKLTAAANGRYLNL